MDSPKRQGVISTQRSRGHQIGRAESPAPWTLPLLLAQELLRHKTSKPDFVGVLWMTVALNVAVFGGWYAGLFPLAKSVG